MCLLLHLLGRHPRYALHVLHQSSAVSVSIVAGELDHLSARPKYVTYTSFSGAHRLVDESRLARAHRPRNDQLCVGGRKRVRVILLRFELQGFQSRVR